MAGAVTANILKTKVQAFEQKEAEALPPKCAVVSFMMSYFPAVCSIWRKYYRLVDAPILSVSV